MQCGIEMVLLEVGTEGGYNVRLSDIVLVRFAGAERLVGVRLPAGVVETKRQVLPETAELVITLVAELAINFAGASGLVR